jgi:bla regulator protein blaR1
MTALWIVFVLLVSLVLAGWAAVAERLTSSRGGATRWPWAAALSGSIVLPLLAAWTNAGGSSPAPTAVPGVGWLAGPEIHLVAVPSAFPWLAQLDLWLLGVWGLSSMVALLAICRSASTLRRRRARCEKGVVAGAPVLISRNMGPAAAGILRREIVVPAWVLDLDPADQRLLIEHEMEHHRAHDPALLLAARLAVVLMPWNLPMRWQLGRLRSAVEIDCDARVLSRSTASARSY